MNRRCRPSSFNDYPEDILPGDNLTCGETDSEVGFRLVHDSSSRVFRGGCCFDAAGCARDPIRGGSLPGYRVGSLGLRLVREEEGK